MKEASTSLRRGLNLDSSKYELDIEELSYALNRCIGSREDNSFYTTTELGNDLKLPLPLGLNANILGHIIYDTELILFCATTTQSIIGIINLNTLTYSDALIVDATITGSDFLSFTNSSVKYIKGIARKNYVQDLLVYFVNDYDNPRGINLTSLSFNSDFNNTTKKWTGTDINKFNEQFNLFNAKTPLSYINNLKVNDGGNLICTTFQFAVRHKLSSSIYTSISGLTNPIPVVDKSETTNSNLYYGNVPDTVANKNISLTLNNIDKTFSYFDLIVIYYTGLSNDVKIGVIENISTALVNNGTLNYTFSDINAINSYITLNELVQQFATYNSAGDIIEKDNTLILAKLKKQSINYTKFQSIANSIQVFYTLSPQPYVDNSNIIETSSFEFSDTGTYTTTKYLYKDPSNQANFKTWCPDEVYSFAFVPIMSDGSQGYAFHIQAPYHSGMNNGDIIYPSTTNVTTGNYQPLGTYKSQNNFPFETGTDEALRFHVTPSCQDISFITSDSNITINLIKLKFVITNTTDLDYFISNNTIKGWKIVRQSKITSTNKRVISSGLLLNTAYLYATTSPSWIAASPLFDAIGVGNAFGNSHGSYSTFALGDVTTVNASTNTSNYQSFVYISPDIIENNYNLISGNAIKVFAQVSSNTTFDVSGLVRRDDGSLPTGANPASSGQKSGIVMIFNSNNISSTKNNWDTSIRDVDLRYSNQINVSYKNAITLPDNTNYKHYLLDSKLFYFNTGVLIPRQNPNTFNKISYYTDEQLAIDYISPTTVFTLALNINVVTYYGNYQTFTYQDVATNYLDAQQPDNYTISDVFNGDKFWTKYAIRNKCCINHVANVTTPQQGDIASVTSGTEGNHYGATLGAEALYYGWFLTEGNYDLKHYITASSTNNNVGTQPFFPASSVLRTSDDTTGILTYAPSLGYATGYNKQYNGTKALQTYTVFPSLVQITNDFSTTHIWSNTQIEGDVNDYYRVFLVANYYSLSRRTGSITRMFIKNNILYTLTKTGLWRNYYNSLNQQATTIGQVFLGTGSAFSIPSTLLNEGEYLGGLQHYNGIVNTPYGTIWFDSISRTFWIFAGGEGIQEENNLNRNINNYLRKFIPNSVYDYLTNSSNFQDDPFKSNTGVTLTYDFYYNRLIVQFYNATTPLTLSFSFIIKDWVSFHSHNNNYFIDYNKLLLSINNNNLYEWYTNNSTYLTFNANSYDFILEFIFNKGFKPVASKQYEIGQDTTKVTDNYVIKSDLLDNTGVTLQQKTFDILTVNNDNQTNTVDLIVNNADYAYETITTGQQLVKYHNQEFRLKNPLDNSEDPKRFKDKYLRIRFKLNGTNILNIYKFILYYIKIIFRENER